jgi:S-adenosylmethionine:tRNA ribosyltransferase-isomerase
MLVKDFDFPLPPELIAQRPLERRDNSRMMVVRRAEKTFHHAFFREFPDFVGSGGLVILNDTKVIPAKVWGQRGPALVEFLLFRPREPGTWDVLCRPAKKIRTGDRIVFSDSLTAVVTESGEEGRRVLKFDVPDVLGHLREIGYAPLPPYIKRRKADAADRPDDLERYQTVFAEKEGAIAAPTAGLHFTPEVLTRLADGGGETARVTLQVGLATFQPMRAERIEDHRMLKETYTVSNEAAAAIERAKAEKRPVVAVGTTVVRTLESAARVKADGGGPDTRSGLLSPGTRETSLFIYPGFEFKVVDRLLTNFHLPQSTLLMLVSAFAGRELILDAYREAIRERYRFFSYGDCMLIL